MMSGKLVFRCQYWDICHCCLSFFLLSKSVQDGVSCASILICSPPPPSRFGSSQWSQHQVTASLWAALSLVHHSEWYSNIFLLYITQYLKSELHVLIHATNRLSVHCVSTVCEYTLNVQMKFRVHKSLSYWTTILWMLCQFLVCCVSGRQSAFSVEDAW